MKLIKQLRSLIIFLSVSLILAVILGSTGAVGEVRACAATIDYGYCEKTVINDDGSETVKRYYELAPCHSCEDKFLTKMGADGSMWGEELEKASSPSNVHCRNKYGVLTKMSPSDSKIKRLYWVGR